MDLHCSSELQLGKRHVGRVLYGTLCAPPRRLTAVQTLLEDEAGKVIKLSMYHVVPSTTSMSAVEALFPEGMRLAIKEPYFKQYQDFSVGLRVDNPADVVAVETGGDCELEGEAASTLEAVELLRKQGNSWFAAEQWKLAIDLYTKCVDACESSSLEPRVCKLALSNRAEAWLRVHQHENALRDAVKALSIDPGHDKSMLRKAKALCGLQCYGVAIACLEALLKQLQDGKSRACPIQRKEVMEVLREARSLDQQSRLGVYHPRIFLKRSDGVRPKCTEYVGPVEIRQMEGDKRSVGRGLFVTRDVREGELLLVSNALAVASCQDTDGVPHLGMILGDEMHDSVSDDLITQVMQVAMASPRRLLQLYSLTDGTDHPPVPAMILFKPPAGLGAADSILAQEGRLPEMDVARIHRIVRTNAFQDSSKGREVRSPSGVWVLPSFLNHSCIPNAYWTPAGDAMFVRAIRDISAGSEVTTPYFDIRQPVQERNRILSRRGFRCCCSRCSFERGLVAEFPVLDRLAVLKTSVNHEWSLNNPHPQDATIVSELDKVLQALEPQHAKRKDWVRASYLHCYWTTQAMNGPGSLSFLFNLTFGIAPTLSLLAAVTQAVRYKESLDPRCIKRWNELAVRICKCNFGPQEPAVYKALMEQALTDAERDLQSPQSSIDLSLLSMLSLGNIHNL